MVQSDPKVPHGCFSLDPTVETLYDTQQGMPARPPMHPYARLQSGDPPSDSLSLSFPFVDKLFPV